MAAFHSDTRPILGRGPSILLRFVFFALLSFAIMWLDQRQGYLERVRYALSMVAYPFQSLVNFPGAGWAWLSESFSTRERLQKENAELQARLREADLRLMRFAALEQENIRLRAMREATAGIAERVVVAEIMRVDLNPFRHRVLLNKGANDGVFKGQPLLDAKGVFGQITRAGAFSSEAILISDTEHAIPVQVNRNGLRSIAVGTGDLSRLSVPFLPINADIRAGDLLVTSGLGGVFPPGYPVAIVNQVNKSQAQTLATVSARPAAALDRDREVLLVWLKKQPKEPDGGAEAAATPGDAPAQRPAETTPRPPAAPATRTPARKTRATPAPTTQTPRATVPAAPVTAPPEQSRRPTAAPDPPAQEQDSATQAPDPTTQAPASDLPTATPSSEPAAPPETSPDGNEVETPPDPGPRTEATPAPPPEPGEEEPGEEEPGEEEQ